MRSITLAATDLQLIGTVKSGTARVIAARYDLDDGMVEYLALG